MCFILIFGILLTPMPALPYHVRSKVDNSHGIVGYDLLRLLTFERAGSYYDEPKRKVVTKESHYLLDCCPSETRLITPRGGKSRDDTLLQLYRGREVVQTFNETRCRRDVINKPCQLVDPRYRHASHCVQEYNYVYAFVKDFNVTSQDFRLDYVRVKSACSCQFNITVTEEIDYSQN